MMLSIFFKRFCKIDGNIAREEKLSSALRSIGSSDAIVKSRLLQEVSHFLIIAFRVRKLSSRKQKEETIISFPRL